MTDDKQLDHLIGVLYETVLNPSRWQEAIGLCGYFVGGVDAHMVTVDKELSIPVASVLSSTNVSIEADDDYVNHYLAIDPRFPSILDTKNFNAWRCCHHINDQALVDRSEFYQDFLLPWGIRYVMGALMDDCETQYTFLGVLRAVGQQPFNKSEQLAAQRFGGHLQRTLRLQRHTQNLQSKAELGARAIDTLALAMLIVDGKGMILHLNTAAEYLLNNRVDGLLCRAGRLSINDPFCRNRLAALIAEATSRPAVGGAMLLSGAESRQLFVTPLPAASLFTQDWQKPLALILLVEPGKTLRPIQLLAKLYDLSPAEQRVASALLAGNSPEQYAEEACVSIFTVRTQLKSLFRKTNTNRQSELVAVLSRVPPLQS